MGGSECGRLQMWQVTSVGGREDGRWLLSRYVILSIFYTYTLVLLPWSVIPGSCPVLSITPVLVAPNLLCVILEQVKAVNVMSFCPRETPLLQNKIKQD